MNGKGRNNLVTKIIILLTFSHSMQILVQGQIRNYHETVAGRETINFDINVPLNIIYNCIEPSC